MKQLPQNYLLKEEIPAAVKDSIHLPFINH